MWRQILNRVTGGGGATSGPPFAPFVGAYGKLPHVGDFVAVRANLEPALGFQGWLARAVDWGDRRQLPGWPTVFDGRPPAAFTYRPRPRLDPTNRSGVLVGVVRASRDVVGRRFPFTIFSAVGDDLATAGAHLLPLAMQPFVEQAVQLFPTLDTATSVSEVEARIAALRPVEIEDGVAIAYDNFVRTTPANAAWNALYGSPSTDGPLYAIKMVRETLAPFALMTDIQTEIAVRLPIKGSPFEVAFWFDLAQRLGGRLRPVPSSLFYPLASPPGRSLYITLGESHPSLLCEATVGNGDTDIVCDLTTPTPAHSSVSRLSATESRIEQEMRREAASLADILNAAGPVPG